MKQETKTNGKPTINNKYESDDDSYSEGNHSILKDTETKDLINIFMKSWKAEKCTDVMFKLAFYCLSVTVEDLNL